MKETEYKLTPNSQSNIDKEEQTSSQDGGIGRHTVPPRTTKRRTTTNLKTKTTRSDRK